MNNRKLENGGSNPTFRQGGALPQEGFFQIVVRHRWTILVTTILCLVVTFLFLLKATPIYTSTSRLYVEQSGPKIMSEYEGVMTQSKNYLYTQGELIKSTPIVADVVDDSEISNFKTFADVDNLAAYLKKNLDVRIGRKDDIIAVSFDSPYPVEAAELVNTVVDSYINYHSSRKQSTVSQVLQILQKEKVKRDKELSDKFAELLEFTRENGLVSLDNQGGHIVLERLNKLATALTESQLSALNAKADYEATKSMESEPSRVKQFASASSAAGVRVLINDKETQLETELRAAEIELKNARYHGTEEHPAIQAIHAKIDRIKQELDEQAREFADSYIEVMRLRWITARDRENELQASFDTQLRAARDLGIKATEYSVLQSELKRTERLCEILDNRIKELNVTEDVGALNISVLEVARPADSPSKPEKAKYMAMALALGLMLGCGLAVLRDMMDYRLRSADEISVVLGIPVLGVVPTMSPGQAIALNGHEVLNRLKLIIDRVHRKIAAAAHTAPAKDRTASAQAAPAESDIRSEEQGIVERGQKAYLEPRSVEAEAYRTIRTAVFFGIPEAESKTILVTSPAPGDGKSTVVSNLAITMAQAGQRTLVLDADFRKPMQHNIFQIDGEEKGLSQLLAGINDLEEAVEAGPVEGLDILRCSSEVPNPSEVLNSRSFARALQAFSERYDRVIIDSPPVGPVADSQILSALCDVTLLVLRAERSTRRHSQQARDGLVSVGGYILGAIVNDVPRRRGHYGYYSAYARYGGYEYALQYNDRESEGVLQGK